MKTKAPEKRERASTAAFNNASDFVDGTDRASGWRLKGVGFWHGACGTVACWAEELRYCLTMQKAIPELILPSRTPRPYACVPLRSFVVCGFSWKSMLVSKIQRVSSIPALIVPRVPLASQGISIPSEIGSTVTPRKS
jgi:hypothetical protein